MSMTREDKQHSTFNKQYAPSTDWS